MGRPKGSKNKFRPTHGLEFDRKAQSLADKFIANEHIIGAELLALRILEKIRASKKRLAVKYGDKL